MRVAAIFLLVVGCSETKMPPFLPDPGRPPGRFNGSARPDGGVPSDASANVVLLAANQPNPRGIATDGTYVYYTCFTTGSPNSGSVRRVPKTGGNFEELASNVDQPFAITIAKSEAIVSLHDPIAVAGAIIATSLTPGGTTRTIAPNVPTPSWLTTDLSTFVYYPNGGFGGGITVSRVGIAGGVSQDVAFVSGAFSPGGVALEGNYVYFTAGGAGGTVYRSNVMGGGAEALDQEPGALFADLVLAAGRVWVADATPNKGRIVSVPTQGGKPRVDVIDIDRPAHVASDGNWVYFTSFAQNGAIGAVAIADGTVRLVADGLSFPFAIAVDDAVYVSTADAILRIPKL